MINDLKDLKKVLMLCRSMGVTEITLGTDTIKLGAMPEKRTRGKRQESDLPFPTNGLTAEQLAFYSVDPQVTYEDIQS